MSDAINFPGYTHGTEALARSPVTLADFEEVAQAEIKGPAGTGRPTSSVVRTISTGQAQ